MKPIHIKARFQLTEGFNNACEVAGIEPEVALQKFIDSVTIDGYLQEFNKSSAKLSGEFIRLSYNHLQIEKKLLKNDTIKADISTGYLRKIVELRAAGMSQSDKDIRYRQLVSDWYHSVFG